MNTKKITGFALAATAAAMFATAPMTVSAGGHAKGHCGGVNACKGHSSCKTANSACKGQNSCKGTGWVAASKDVCSQLGGKYSKA
jgi:hypothetical protein